MNAGDEVSNIDIVFLCAQYSGELLVNKDESKDLKFFDINKLPSNISLPQQKAIQAYVDYKNALEI